MRTILLALLAAASNACASVLQREANLREVQAGRRGLAGLANLLRQPLWLAGIGAVIVSFLLQAAALTTGELAEVQPLMSLELPMALLLASRAFHRPLRARTWADILAMTGGMAVFLYSLHPSPGEADAPDGPTWAWAAGVTGGVVIALAVAGFLVEGARRAALLGAGTGISFALTATFIAGALARGVSWGLFTRWQTYLAVVAGLSAMVLFQEALQAGSLVVVQPAVTLVDPAVSVLLGVLLLSETVRTGPWIIGQLAGAAAVAWGAVQLSRSPMMNPDDDQTEPPDVAPADRSAEPSGADAADGAER
jgi:drug/metabolite transporter (DMT)-like permease